MGRIDIYIHDAKPMTELTQRWRNMVRGENRYATQVMPRRQPGGGVEEKNHPWVEKKKQESGSQLAWARRKAIGDPRNRGKLRWGPKGELLNKVDLEGNLLD